MKKNLKICAVGNSSSIHIKKRTVCFAERGHQVSVISPVAEAIPGVRTVYVPKHHSKFGLPAYMFRLMRAIWAEKADIVHLHYAEVYQLTACRLAGRKLAVTLMGSDIVRGFSELAWPQRQLLVFMLKRADLLNPKSHSIAAMLADNIGKHPNILTTYWGVDLNRFKPTERLIARQQLGLEFNGYFILSPRLLKPLYNIDLIIQALPIVLQRLDAKLLLCESKADADYKARLQALIKELDLGESVIFLGEIDNDVMPMLYNAADVAIGIPNHDGMPISLLEGMACGIVNIIPKLPSYCELVTDRESVYCVDYSPKEIAEAVIDVLENPSLQESIRNNAYRTVAEKTNFAIDVHKIENAFIQIANDQ